MKSLVWLGLCLLVFPILVGGEEPPGPNQQGLDNLKARIDALEKAHDADRKKYDDELKELQARAASTEQQTTAQAAKVIPQSFNPDISINADFLFHASSHEATDSEKRKFFAREVEIGFSGAVDPYGKYNLVTSIAEDPATGEFGIDIEEAYYTFLELPGDMLLKVGKFRQAFGKANPTHLHALPWIDYPLIVRNFFGDEGLKGEGLSANLLIPNPWDYYLEFTAEVTNNDNAVLFAGTNSNDITALAHLKNFWEVSEAGTVEFGLSAANGANTEVHLGKRSWIEGTDLTYRWRPLANGLYQFFELRGEAFLCQKQFPLPARTEHSWGAYGSAAYQFAERWTLSARYDYSQTPDDHSLTETDYSGYLTFTQSEFAFLRVGYTYQKPDFGLDQKVGKSTVFFQLNITLGTHPAHQY